MFGSIVMVVGSFIQGFSVNVAMYIIARMFLGFGIVFAVVSSSAMVDELAYPKEWAIMASLFNASWLVGSFKELHLESLLLPESPRYLVSKDRRHEAFNILVKYHAEGSRDSVFVRVEIPWIQERGLG
ncbi:hypothetical protein DSL72_008518 [Monilinia vaccinii-corymbosi]|uniref:Major facilitator superfamily (MFS) profile domain-containing protein n=1 Tax=Monilinia vaccinii-corymbosi TaxID=61207 RepID=A0A8A3PK01_9HELO|nr:hypothetical protein DSL72_008518 [Monilinia vaccinii-corymbosi]